MSTATLPAPTIAAPITNGGDIQDNLADHRAAAAAQHNDDAPAIEPGEEWDPFTAAREAQKKADDTAYAKKPVVKAEEPKTEKVEAKEDPAPAKKLEVTDATTDAELEAEIEAASKGMTKDARERLKHANFETRESRRQLKALQTELEQVRKQAPAADAVQALQKEREALQKRIDEQESELAGSRVEKTQMFQKEIAAPMAELETQFKKFSSEYDVPAEDLLALTELKGRAQDARFEELTGDWPKRKADKLADLVDRHSELLAKRNEVQAKAKDIYNNTVAQEREARELAEAKLASERQAALPEVWEKNILAAAPFLKESKDPELAQLATQTKAFVDQADDKWFSTQPVAERVRLTAQAAAFPAALKHIQSLEAEIATLTTRVKEFRAGTPDAGGDAGARSERAPVHTGADEDWDPIAKARGMR